MRSKSADIVLLEGKTDKGRNYAAKKIKACDVQDIQDIQDIQSYLMFFNLWNL